MRTLAVVSPDLHSLFLQYLDRGVFVLDEPLARLVAQLPGDNFADAKFKQNIMGRLKDPRVQLDLMQYSPSTFAYAPSVDYFFFLSLSNLVFANLLTTRPTDVPTSTYYWRCSARRRRSWTALSGMLST